jgi:hypothetical protein
VINHRDSRFGHHRCCFEAVQRIGEWRLMIPGRLRGPAVEGGLLASLDVSAGEEENGENKLT